MNTTFARAATTHPIVLKVKIASDKRKLVRWGRGWDRGQGHGEVRVGEAPLCPGRKAPVLAVKRPARPYRNAIENRFA